MPAWWYNKFESAVEFLLIGIFFVILANLAGKQGTDLKFLKTLKIWTWLQFGLFLIFLVLVYTWDGYYIPYGALYILSLGLALGISIRMRKTVDGIGVGEK